MFPRPESRALSTLSPTTQRRFCSPSPPFHPSFLSVLPPPPTLGPLDRQPLRQSSGVTLCVLLRLLPTLSYCCSPAVCVLILTLIDSGLGPGVVVGGKSHVFFFLSLILFFCLPSNLSLFPHQKKKKTNTNKISKRNYTFGPGCLCLLCPAA